MHFEAAARLFEQGGFERAGDEGYRNRAAVLYAMLCGHTAFEDALLRTMAILEETPPSGSDWHTILIARAANTATGRRPPILDQSLAAAARETRDFRHVAAHGYRMEFDLMRARPAVDAGLVLARGIMPALAEFSAKVDPD